MPMEPVRLLVPVLTECRGLTLQPLLDSSSTILLCRLLDHHLPLVGSVAGFDLHQPISIQLSWLRVLRLFLHYTYCWIPPGKFRKS